jgi:cobalt-zinc-cadmium efflux system membrane fusion protein
MSSPVSDPAPAGARRGGRLFGAVVNVIVFSALAGVLYAGHHTGWKLPHFAGRAGGAAPAPDDWCPEHLVPESKCVECNEKLFPKAKEFGFCKVHGVMECVTCHPELAQVRGEPRLPAYDTARAIAVKQRPENNSRNTLHKRLVQFTSQESAAKAGIDVDVVAERPMSDTIVANGEILFNPTRVAHLSPRVSGTVTVVYKTLGDEVQTGEILALVDGAAVGQAKSQLMQAIIHARLKRTTVERLRAAGGSVPARTLTEAEAASEEADVSLLAARQALLNLGFEIPDGLEGRDAEAISDRLRVLGIPAASLAALPPGTKSANLIPVVAPYPGVVVASDVVAGEVVNASKLLFTIADPRHVWLTLNVRQEDTRYLRPGLDVAFRTDDGFQEVNGKLTWISPVVNEHTRTLQVRVQIDNADRRLRDHTFGSGRIVLRAEPKAVVVPREAVQSTSDAHFVFVRDKNFLKEESLKLFHVRQVRIGAQDDRYVELLAGALPGEVVATKGSAVLLAQLLRSSLGAGCGCHEH